MSFIAHVPVVGVMMGGAVAQEKRGVGVRLGISLCEWISKT